MIRMSFIIVTMLLLAGCSQMTVTQTLVPNTYSQTETAQGTKIQDIPVLPIQGNATSMTPLPSTPAKFGLESHTEKAKEDLAQRLSIPITQIIVLDARVVTWSNSSLGCPQPGMLYADVLTPGYLILLSADGEYYEYHAGKGSDVFYCENPLPPVEGIPDNT